ncbi:MAG: hypothetical protein U0V72_00665 [Cytophagales bacterium]
MAQFNIEIKGDNALQESKAAANFQKLSTRLKASGINKLMEMYDNPIKKLAVESFLKSNGI